MSKQRIPYIDFAAGIMILWMIIYHAIGCALDLSLVGLWGISDASLIPEGAKAFIKAEGKLERINVCVLFPYLSFFMPWFFYKSGQFFEKRPIKESLTKDARKLLLTFVIWSAIGYVMFLLFGVLNHSLTLKGATYSIARGLFLTGKVPINEPLWFLLTLFGVRFIANTILPNRHSQYSWLSIMAIVIVGYVIAYLAYRFNHPLLPYWVANGASGLAFFALGYGLRNYEIKWWIIVPCILVYILCCFVGFPMVDMIYNTLLAGEYLLWIPVAFCGIVTFNALCRFIYKHVRIRPIEIAGQNAMNIYVTHILIVMTCIFIMEYYDLSQLYPYTTWILLGSYVLFLPLFCYLFNLIGNRKSA